MGRSELAMKRVVAFSLATQPCCASLVSPLAPVAPECSIIGWLGAQVCNSGMSGVFQMFFFAVNLFTSQKTFSVWLFPIMQILQSDCTLSQWMVQLGKDQAKQILSPRVRAIYMEKSNYNETLLLYPLVILNKGTEKVTCCSAVHWSGAFVTTESMCWKDKCR